MLDYYISVQVNILFVYKTWNAIAMYLLVFVLSGLCQTAST